MNTLYESPTLELLEMEEDIICTSGGIDLPDIEFQEL